MHATKPHLAQILYKSFGEGVHKAKTAKTELKFEKIFLKFWKLASNYITKLSIYPIYARHNYEIL